MVPILLNLVKAISSVRLYIPKDLRSLDSRQSVGKSIKVSTYMYDQIEIFRNQVVTVFLRYHTFAPYYSSRLGNPGNFCVCNPECRKLFPVQSRIQVPLTRNHNPLPGIPNSQHGIKNLITLSGAIIYLFIYLFIQCLQEVKRRFPDGLPLLDPIEDMGIKDDGLKTVIRVCIWSIAFEPG